MSLALWAAWLFVLGAWIVGGSYWIMVAVEDVPELLPFFPFMFGALVVGAFAGRFFYERIAKSVLGVGTSTTERKS